MVRSNKIDDGNKDEVDKFPFLVLIGQLDYI